MSTSTKNKSVKCDRCGKKAVTWSFRPSYIDEDGDLDGIGKATECADCALLDDRDWIVFPNWGGKKS